MSNVPSCSQFRGFAFASVAIALPLLLSASALAQPRAPAAAPPSRVMTPNVQLSTSASVDAPAAAAEAVAAAPAPEIQAGVAALVNDEIVSSYDLTQRMKLLIATTGVQPTQENLPQLQQEALRSLVDEHLQLQEIKRIAKKQKANDIIADDKEVDDEISDIAKENNLTFAQMKQSFAQSQIDIQTLREQIRTQITWQRLVGGMYGHNIRVSEDQITSTLQRMSNQASQTQYQLGQIFLENNRAGSAEKALQDATQIIQYVQKGADFRALARQVSSDPTAANGGDTGWITASQAQPEVAKALDQLRPGQISAPIPVSDGVYIVLLRDKQAASGQTMVALKQAAVRLDKDATEEQIAAAGAALRTIKPQIKGCDNLEQIASKTPGVVPADLGEADINDLSPQFKEAAEKLQAGQVSDPIRTNVGLHLVAVCSKRNGSSKLPSRNDISSRLQSEQLSVMSRRYLRDLRNSATIEAR